MAPKLFKVRVKYREGVVRKPGYPGAILLRGSYGEIQVPWKPNLVNASVHTNYQQPSVDRLSNGVTILRNWSLGRRGLFHLRTACGSDQPQNEDAESMMTLAILTAQNLVPPSDGPRGLDDRDTGDESR